MKLLHVVAVLALSGLIVSGAEQPNRLSKEEKAQGWTLLFDGKSTEGWQTLKRGAAPADKWAVTNGWLMCLGKGGGDIVTAGKYEQFDLTWEWKLEAGGNSGLKYFIQPSRGAIGHEYQMLDDDRHPDAKLAGGKRKTAAFYDVLKCQAPTEPRPMMEINISRVLVQGNHVEHWLNGSKVLEYELGSPEVKAAVLQSKFKQYADFGTRVPGLILLQDHNAKVWFRNMKIRDLSK